MTTITIERGLVLKLYLYWLEDISPDRLEAFRDKLRAVLGVPVTALEQLDPADLCDVCGEPVRYGSRHHACGDSVLRANATSSPATAPEQCWCQTCRPITQADNRMVLCPDCGNKRCPKATDHRNACTGSNEPGQPGSSYPTVPATAPEQPAWHGAPTCAGVWLSDRGYENPYRWGTYNVVDPAHEKGMTLEDERWFGPIPEDKP